MPKTLLNVKEDILQATREIMAEQGYHNLNIRDIAKRCGIATGTFYNYFQSKQEVLVVMMAEDWSRMKKRIEAGLESQEQPKERLRVIFEELSRTVQDVHTLWVEGIPAYMQENSFAKAQKLKRQLRAEICDYVARVLSPAVPADRVPMESELITRVFFSYANDTEARFDAFWYALEKMIR